MENNLYTFPHKINLINKSFFLDNNLANTYNQNSCICNCECHKNNISYNSNKSKIQIKKLNNNFFNLKLNQEILHKPINKEIKQTKRELPFNRVNDKNDFNFFVDDLHKMKNNKYQNKNKKIKKSMSFKGIIAKKIII